MLKFVVLELQREESIQLLTVKRALKETIEQPQESWTSLDAFTNGIDDLQRRTVKDIETLQELAKKVHSDIEAARKVTEKHRNILVDQLGKDIKLGEQLQEAEEQIRRLKIKIQQLNGELDNARTASMVAELDRNAAEAVGILSDEEMELKDQEKKLESELDTISKEIDERVIEINTCQAKVDSNKDRELNQANLDFYRKKLEGLNTKKSATEQALNQKRKEFGAVQRCPVCIRRKSSLSTSSQA